jgi:hypothetical protein
MKNVKLNNIETAEYWKAFPQTSRRSKPQVLKDKTILRRISRAITSDLESVDFCFEDPEAPKFSLILHRGTLKPIYLRVYSNSVMYGDRCFVPVKGKLWMVLQKSLKRRYESVHCPDLD